MHTVRLLVGSLLFTIGIAFWVWFLRNLFRRRSNQALLFVEYYKGVQIICNTVWIILGLWIYPIPVTVPLVPLIAGLGLGWWMSKWHSLPCSKCCWGARRMKSKGPFSVRWIFNSLMIWGAVLGFLIYGGASTIIDTWNHKGPGVVWYESPERAEREPESQYKRHNYTVGFLLLATGLGLWIIKAVDARERATRDL